jgi:putative addiction module CopG family antidote
MNIHLRPELEDLVRQDVERGHYHSVDEFVEQAISMLHDQEAWLADHREEIFVGIEEGHAAARRGELIDSENIRSMIEKKKHVFLSGKHGQ